jgi:hypothetical protein
MDGDNAITLAQAKRLEKEVLEAIQKMDNFSVAARRALLKMKQTEAYKQLGYDTIRDWARSKITADDSMAARLRKSAYVEDELGMTESEEPLPDRQLKALNKVPRGERKKAWGKVLDYANETKAPVTEKLIRHVVNLDLDTDTVVDGTGEAVEGPMEKVFESVALWNDSLNQLSLIRRRVMGMVGQPGGEQVNTAAIAVVFTQLTKEIKAAVPYAVCPNGECQGGCEACYGTGWVNRKRYKDLEE